MFNLSLTFLVLISFVSVQSNPIQSTRSLCQTLVLSYKTCVDVLYFDENNVNVKISLGGSLLHDQNVDVKNPKPICGSKLGAQVCYEFVVTPQDSGFNTCVTVKGTYPFLGTITTNLGCTIVSNNSKYIISN